MSTTPLVTVIVPNYNHAPYLKQRIDSVLGQTFQDFELILLDDCSQDHSREIIKQYQHVTRIRIVLNERNSGCVFKQWNKGLQMAVGKYVWLAESDDYSSPEFLQTLIARLEANPKIGLAFCDSLRVCGTEVTPARGRWFGEFASGYDHDFQAAGQEYVARQMLFINTIPNASSVVFRRSIAEAVGPADESYLLSGDWLYWIKLLSCSDLAYIATPLNFYRYHQQTARHANAINGVMIEEACRISLFVLNNFPVSPPDAAKIRARLTGWFVETMLTTRSTIPVSRQRNIRRLACELNPKAQRQLWLRRTGLLWLWLGCRHRVRNIWRKFLPAQTLRPS